jgi:aryl-alcohol dehydrogenase-like predicted oxidoreductase
MEKRQLGNSDMHITTIGFGAWAIGGDGWAFGWGPQDDMDSISAIHHALDMGINWIDTAAVYGTGHSEEVVAQALKGRADKPYVFTKCSRMWDENRVPYGSLKRHTILQECEDSLRRLQTDVIDLYQIHWPNPEEDMEEGWTALADLQRLGKVRWIGVSNFSAEQMARAQAIAPITSLQPPYSMIRRDIEASILPYCQANNIGVIVYSPMQSGLLTGAFTHERVANLPDSDWRKRNPQYQEPLLSRNLKLAELLKEIGERHGVSAGAVAIAWTLKHPAVTAAIVGARRPDQVDGIIGGGNIQLSDDDLAQIESFMEVHA